MCACKCLMQQFSEGWPFVPVQAAWGLAAAAAGYAGNVAVAYMNQPGTK